MPTVLSEWRARFDNLVEPCSKERSENLRGLQAACVRVRDRIATFSVGFHLRSEAEFAAIREACAGVPIHGRAIDFAQEFLERLKFTAVPTSYP